MVNIQSRYFINSTLCFLKRQRKIRSIFHYYYPRLAAMPPLHQRRANGGSSAGSSYIASQAMQQGSFSTLCSKSHSFFKPYPFRMTLLPILLVRAVTLCHNRPGVICPDWVGPPISYCIITMKFTTQIKRERSIISTIIPNMDDRLFVHLYVLFKSQT